MHVAMPTVIRRGLLAVMLVAAIAGHAQELSFQLDAAQSHVEFTLDATLHTVHGKLSLKESTVQLDPKTGKASGAIIVDATSSNTGNDTRDHKMHKEVLESAKYREIVFALQTIQGSVSLNGSSQVKLSGVMRIHGGEHPLTVSVPVQVANSQATADVHFTVPYVQWGMKDPSTFLLHVSKEVQIDVHAVGSLAEGPKP